MSIHKSAMIHPKANIGKNNTIGPNVIIEEGVTIGDNNSIGPGVYIFKGTTVGDRNEIHIGAVIGNTPQDISFKDWPSFTTIGSDNRIREYVTIHRGAKEGTTTKLGNNNFIMGLTHIAHNCEIGNNVITVNLASLSGHCIIEDGVFISGIVGLHQFSRVGRLAIVSGVSAVNKDIPPYMMCGGRPAVCQGVNSVALRRAGFTLKVRGEIKQAYKLLYKSGLNVANAIKKIKEELHSEEVGYLVNFIESSKRGIAAGRGEERETILTEKI